MSHVDIKFELTGDNPGRLLLDMFETQNVGTGMAKLIPGGAAIGFCGSPEEKPG
jgi:hypothetical protein